jgi:hypothetical protein
MIVKIDKSFQKDVNKINDQKIRSSIVETIQLIREAESLSAINNLKKLTGLRHVPHPAGRLPDRLAIFRKPGINTDKVFTQERNLSKMALMVLKN